MRRLVLAGILASAMVFGYGAQAWAAPPDRTAPGKAWTVQDGRTITWTSPGRVPVGDAMIEFWDGDKLLGRPTTTDHRTFTLTTDGTGQVKDLQVRAGGRRLDQPLPPVARRAAPPAAPALGKPGGTDPGTPGRFATTTGEYQLAGLPIAGYPAPVEVQAVVVAPVGAPGRRPLALFLHGRHSTCYQPGDADVISVDWPCPAGLLPIPSHRGYLQAQQLLASQGYVTVSISANGINGQDYVDVDGGAQARSSLVRTHLARWADWAGAGRATAPAIVKQAPVADLSKVFLMGHSRGGEGVNRAAMDSLTPPPAAQDDFRGKVRWTIRGALLIGPTIFGQNPVPDLPTATILPGCDGDVSDLQGQMYIDATRGVSKGRALHSSLYFVGANHNYFNTEWTPGQAVAPAWDDFPEDYPDPVCAPGTATRLTAAQQQTAGATYIAAAARLFVGGDDRVRPLLDGTGVRAPSADPARVLSHAIGAARTAAAVPGPGLRVGGSGRLCEQVTDEEAKACLVSGEGGYWSPSPHFTSFGGIPDEDGRYAVAIDWTAAGQAATLRPARPAKVRGELAMRIVVPPNTSGTRFGVTATDSRGKRVALGDVTVDGLPGSEFATPYWAREVRVPLKGLTSIARLDLVPRTASGSAILIDAWGWQGGTPDPRPAVLPRVDLGDLTVTEGDSGSVTYRIPATVTGRGEAKVRVFVIDATTLETKTWVATVRPGDRSIRVPVTVTGNTIWTEGQQYVAGMKAIRGAFVGNFFGLGTVVENDPPPVVTVTPAEATVAEGGTLTWRVTLSEPAGSDIYVGAQATPPAAGPELSTTDLDPQWFAEYIGEDPLPERPFSSLGYVVPETVVPAGELTGELTLPTAVDDVAEPAEHITLDLSANVPLQGQVTGTVTG